MSKFVLICWIFLIFGQLKSKALTGSTDEDQDMLGQVLGLVQEMKSQLDNLEVKVGNMDDEIKEIKNQTSSFTKLIKGVKTQVVSATEDMENTVDSLSSQIQSVIGNTADDDVEDEKISFEQATQVSIESHRAIDGNINKTIRCGMSHNISDVNIILLSILVSDSASDNLESFKELARIDIWTQRPVVGSNASTTHVSGIIDQDNDAKSYLAVSRNVSSDSPKDRETYKCDIQGFESEGRPVAASDTIVDGGSLGTTYQNEDTFLLETISFVVEANSRKLENMAGQVLKCNDTGEDLLNGVEGLKTEVTRKLDVIYQTMEEYKTNDSLQCNKVEIVDMLLEMNENVSTQFNNIGQEINGVKNGYISVHENNTKNINMISDQLAATDVREVNDKIKRLGVKVTGIDDTIVKVDTNVKSFNDRMKSLETKQTKNNDQLERLVDMFSTLGTAVNTSQTYIQTVGSKIDMLEDILNNKLEKVSKTCDLTTFTDPRFQSPKISHVRYNKLYVFSKERKTFDINVANNVCKEHGGYLLEFDDEDEYEFIKNIINPMLDANPAFYTGYTDRSIEGKFVHVHSGRELAIDKWYIGEPNNVDHDEDCVEIHAKGIGLNDRECDFNSSYICEIPYPF